MKASLLFFATAILLAMTNFNAKSQEIRIDSLFQVSGECYPFQGVDSITGLRISGHVELKSDTSLARVVLICADSTEYMVFEACPLIVSELEFSFSGICDETCFLDGLNPSSIEIQLVNAELEIGSLFYEQDYQEDLSQLQFASKRATDAEKIEFLNRNILEFDMNWEAGDNSLVEMYYFQKKNLFGEAYNILGYDYYIGGVFEFLGHRDYPKVDPDLVRQFDWRDRHGANDSLSAYWDGDILGTGWLTSVKNQGNELYCYAFGAVGVTEALTNVYTASHIDLDLSERDLYECHDCSANGKVALQIIQDDGIMTEYCLPNYSLCALKCNPVDTLVKITDTLNINEENYDSVRIWLINNGPLLINYQPPGAIYSHVVTLSGYIFNPSDSTLSWIIKNSYGESFGEHGFEIMPLECINYACVAQGPVLINDTAIDNLCRDEDSDGYYFWGVGPKPDTLGEEDVEDCDDNNPFVGGYDENYNCECIFTYDPSSHIISMDTSWSDSMYVNYTLVIDSAATLTISSWVGFSPEAGIIVKQGGELIIDGGYLTKVCPDLWRGIQVWGSDTVQYFDQFFGKVTLRNDAIIEFAKIAVANHCTLCDHQLMQSGGIILAENSIFRDNETDILLASFKNEWYGNELPYYSSFQHCNFVTTDLLYLYSTPKSHVELKDVTGVTFKGCTFNNELTNSTKAFYERGTGIFSTDANFVLDKYCTKQIIPCPEEDLVPCEFSNLEYGVKALNSTSIRTLSLHNINFIKNIVGISLSGIDNASILSNDFLCQIIEKNDNDDRFIGGIFLENCTGFHIEDNNINSNQMGSGSIHGVRYGIGVKNSGPFDNEIYNNNIAKSTIGILAIGENREKSSGLCLKCNDMSQNLNDFVVFEEEDPPLAVEQGIAIYQGNPNDSISDDAPAGNTFTKYISQPADSAAMLYYNYLNNAENIWYFHHQKQIYPDLTYPLDSNYTINTIQLKEWQYLGYEKETACPSGIGGGGLKSIGNPYATILEADMQITALNTQIISLVDGGNTESLNFEVMTSLPDEALELRSELLAESPYLSDTVLKQSIYKEDVLPNAMIRDILEANPHSAKSSEILNTLDSRQEPMPEYMMSQILEGRKFLGAKELLEAKIQTWKLVRAKAKADLMRQFLLDTNQLYAMDSLITFLEGEYDLQPRYDLAFAYWNQKDYSSAQLTLDNVPSDFILNTNQTYIQAGYEDYFDLLEMMNDSNWLANDLDSIHIQQLFDLLASEYGSLSAHARGMLVKGGFYDYIEKVPYPAHLKAAREYCVLTDKSTDENSVEYLRVFPNPAGDFALIQYVLDDKHDVGIIEVSKIDGTLLRAEVINSGTDQMILDLKELSNGIYIVSLKSNGQIIESEKLIKGSY